MPFPTIKDDTLERFDKLDVMLTDLKKEINKARLAVQAKDTVTDAEAYGAAAVMGNINSALRTLNTIIPA